MFDINIYQLIKDAHNKEAVLNELAMAKGYFFRSGTFNRFKENDEHVAVFLSLFANHPEFIEDKNIQSLLDISCDEDITDTCYYALAYLYYNCNLPKYTFEEIYFFRWHIVKSIFGEEADFKAVTKNITITQIGTALTYAKMIQELFGSSLILNEFLNLCRRINLSKDDCLIHFLILYFLVYKKELNEVDIVNILTLDEVAFKAHLTKMIGNDLSKKISVIALYDKLLLKEYMLFVLHKRALKEIKELFFVNCESALVEVIYLVVEYQDDKAQTLFDNLKALSFTNRDLFHYLISMIVLLDIDKLDLSSLFLHLSKFHSIDLNLYDFICLSLQKKALDLHKLHSRKQYYCCNQLSYFLAYLEPFLENN